MNDIKVDIKIKGKLISITPEQNLYESIIDLKKKGVNIISYDPDNCIISREIYKKIFPFYNENDYRGDTLNTYNSTFGKFLNYRLMSILNKDRNTIENKNKIIEKTEEFKHIFLSIGNFTILERWHKKGETPCINCSRGMGKLRDSWPLTLLCIQDYLSGYSKLEENPLRYSFDNNESTKSFFKKYKNEKNGFELFCDDQYFSPKLYDNKDSTYIEEDKNGNYIVKLDLFDGLNFSKPLPLNLKEMEQYINKATIKIIERGKVLLKKYLEKQ